MHDMTVDHAREEIQLLSNRWGGVIYHPADLGLDPDEIADKVGAHRERFVT